MIILPPTKGNSFNIVRERTAEDNTMKLFQSIPDLYARFST